MTVYYSKFVWDYGMIARPYTDQLKNNFFWNQQAQDSFEALKSALSTAPVLRMPDFSKEFVIECGASGTGLGAVLMQDGHPRAY